MKQGTRVKIRHCGKADPYYVSPSGAPVGQLATQGRIGRVMYPSPLYNSSFIVSFSMPSVVHDIHDQHFEYLPCICASSTLMLSGCQCGGI